MKLYENGAYLLNGTEIVEDAGEVKQILAAYHCLRYSGSP